MNEEKKLAILIDSDNVSAKYAQFILQEAGKYGELIYKRIYGDWEKGGNGWHYPALNNSIMPVQQTSYISGKNATDFSMIIDAMDILYTGNVDGFVLVTSDSDFTRLAIRLREAGKLVVGIGEVKTPLAFTSSCHHFSYLNQVCEPAVNYDEKTLRKAILDFVRESDDERLDLLKISAFLTSKFGNIDFDSLGYKRLSDLVDSMPELKRNNTFVTVKKVTESKPASRRRSGVSGDEITNVIIEYLKGKEGGREELSQIDKYITGVFGKVDFSRFGSKRLARFIDGQPQLSRINNIVTLAGNEENKPAAESGETAAESSEKITPEEFRKDVQAYASENMPNGGNLGQLNNMLMEKYGKNYVADLGFEDFATAVLSVTAVKVASNHVFTSRKGGRKPAGKKVLSDRNAAAAEDSEKAVSGETAAEAEVNAENPVEEVDTGVESDKPDVNMIKRQIQSIAAQSGEKGISLAKLGKLLKKQYGEDYLQQLGYRSLKGILGSVAGVNLKLGILYIDEDFARQTGEIEKFVYDVVHGEGKCSLKSLSNGIRKRFDGFDYTDYGYARFSDFINAIDGVKATRYYVEAE